jgi:PIN domain-containing protein
MAQRQLEFFASNPATATHPLPDMNHVFVDFENVCTIDNSIFEHKSVTFTFLLGAGQTKLAVELVEKLLVNAASVELVRLTSRGKNALDFTLAYYLGRAAIADPSGFFHIVSKDTGFDPLIHHLQTRHIRARRHDDFATLNFSVAAKPATPAQTTPSSKPKLQPKNTAPAMSDGHPAQILEHLRKVPVNRPKTRKALVSFVKAQLYITEGEANGVVEELRQCGKINVGDKDKVVYCVD